jgi:hypothetical protein
MILLEKSSKNFKKKSASKFKPLSSFYGIWIKFYFVGLSYFKINRMSRK